MTNQHAYNEKKKQKQFIFENYYKCSSKTLNKHLSLHVKQRTYELSNLNETFKFMDNNIVKKINVLLSYAQMN